MVAAPSIERAEPAPPDPVMLREAFWEWLRIAALSFGGPAGQIAVMHRILVEEKRWIGEHRFLHALNYCMLLPGPEAQQLATYIGWLLHKTRGGIVAGGLFILPGVASIMALSWVYALSGLFFGLKAAVLAIVLQAVVRMSTPIEFSREVPDEKSLVGRVSVISRRVDRGSCFSAVGRDGVAPARLVG